MQTAPDRALQILQAHQQRFAADADVAGQLACGAAVVQTLWYARLGWSEITPWVDRLEPLMRPRRALPVARGRAAQLLGAACGAGVLPAVASRRSRRWGASCSRLIDDAGIDWNQRLSTATHLITYFHNAAEHELATQLIGKVDPAVESAARQRAQPRLLVHLPRHSRPAAGALRAGGDALPARRGPGPRRRAGPCRVRGLAVPHLPRPDVSPHRRGAGAHRAHGGPPGARQPRRRNELLRRPDACSRS